MSQTSNRPKWQTITFWILSVLLGLMFVSGGAFKLAGAEMHVQNFAAWGLPEWMMYVTGAVEVTAGVLLVIPRTRFYGAELLSATMIGAALTHILSGVGMEMLVMNGVLFGLSALLAWTHRPDWVRRMFGSKAEGEPNGQHQAV